MDSELLDLINGIYAHALDAGLSSSFPVQIVYGDDDNTNGEDISIVVFEDEPTSKLFANIFWLNVNESSPDYLKLFIRESKIPSGEYANTWLPVTTMSGLGVDQYYDIEDIIRTSMDTQIDQHMLAAKPHPNYKVIDETGGVLTGKLFTRALTNSQSYDLTEAIPRRTLVEALNSQTNGFYSILQNLNNRVNQNVSEITLLKKRVTDLENGTGGGGGGTPVEGAKFYVHTQDEPLTEWIINHELDSINLIVNVWEARIDHGAGNTVYYEVCPEEKVVFDRNFVVVTFIKPMSGKVIITAL